MENINDSAIENTICVGPTLMCNPPNYQPPIEKLPNYKPTLTYYGVSLLKLEIDSNKSNGIHSWNSYKRRWRPVIIELNSTQLNIFEMKDFKLSLLTTYLFRLRNYIIEDNDVDAFVNEHHRTFGQFLLEIINLKVSEEDKDLINSNVFNYEPSHSKSGGLSKLKKRMLYSLTLQGAKTGICSDIKKYQNCLRVRAEIHQFVLQFWSFNSFINWYEKLDMAKNLSVPLELRKLPSYRTLPANRRAFHYNVSHSSSETSAFQIDRNSTLSILTEMSGFDSSRGVRGSLTGIIKIGNHSTIYHESARPTSTITYESQSDPRWYNGQEKKASSSTFRGLFRLFLKTLCPKQVQNDQGMVGTSNGTSYSSKQLHPSSGYFDLDYRYTEIDMTNIKNCLPNLGPYRKCMLKKTKSTSSLSTNRSNHDSF